MPIPSISWVVAVVLLSLVLPPPGLVDFSQNWLAPLELAATIVPPLQPGARSFQRLVELGRPGINLERPRVLGYYAEDYPGDYRALASVIGNRSHLDYIGTFQYHINGQGQLDGQNLLAFDLYRRQAGIPTLALIHNFSRGGFDAESARELLSDAANRERAIAAIGRLVERLDYAGVIIDLEAVPPDQRENLTAFIAALRETLAPNGKLLAMAVPAKTRDNRESKWSGAFDYQALGRYVDIMQLMTYDEHWIDGGPGPIASNEWVVKVLNYATRLVPRERIYLGIAGYAYVWPEGQRGFGWSAVKAISYARDNGLEVVRPPHSPTPRYWFEKDGRRHEVHYEDGESARLKLRLARLYGLGGVALWRLGLEDRTFWEAVNTELGLSGR